MGNKEEEIYGIGRPVVHELQEGVFAITGLYHTSGPHIYVNAGLILTRGSVVFIDCGQTIASAEWIWKQAAEMMSGQKNLFLILTHHHSDHVFGMRVLREKGALTLAHRIVGEELEGDNGFYKQFIVEKCGWPEEYGDLILGDIRLWPPDRVIEADTSLNLEGDEITIFCTPGHVPDELSVYHQRSRTLFAGDTLYEGIPPTTAFGGLDDWKKWVIHLERLALLEIDAVCPGHGQISSKDLIYDHIGYLGSLIEEKGG